MNSHKSSEYREDGAPEVFGGAHFVENRHGVRRSYLFHVHRNVLDTTQPTSIPVLFRTEDETLLQGLPGRLSVTVAEAPKPIEGQEYGVVFCLQVQAGESDAESVDEFNPGDVLRVEGITREELPGVYRCVITDVNPES